MKSKLAVVLCLHHKPWLGMSTLITLALQDYKDFDLYLLYQAGDGSCLKKESYRDYFNLVQKNEGFTQLSNYDERVKIIVNQFKHNNIYEMEFENDHSLDSGAWYKFIKTKKWREYDYTFFIQEGAVFTRNNAISSTVDFLEKNNINFLSAGHEKRKLAKDFGIRCNTKKNNFSEIDFFHDQQLENVFKIFCRNQKFRELYDNWKFNFKITTQNHVPSIINSASEVFPRIYRSIRRRNFNFLFGKIIHENACKRPLKDVIDKYVEHNRIIFHKDNGLEWFGCSCQHFFSRKFLEDFSNKLEEHKLYDAIDIPFSGGALEIIWGFLPKWLGFDKWFFDGIHRVRKDFVTYKREDDPKGMCKYINRYFKGKIFVIPDGDFIKIKRLNKKFNFLRDILGKDYFVKLRQKSAL